MRRTIISVAFVTALLLSLISIGAQQAPAPGAPGLVVHLQERLAAGVVHVDRRHPPTSQPKIAGTPRAIRAFSMLPKRATSTCSSSAIPLRTGSTGSAADRTIKLENRYGTKPSLRSRPLTSPSPETPRRALSGECRTESRWVQGEAHHPDAGHQQHQSKSQ